jgi:hypothetical protein
MNKRAVALFFAGVTAWESFIHVMLYLLDSVPFRLNGFTIDMKINTIQIVFPAIISLLLIRYARWLKISKNK